MAHAQRDCVREEDRSFGNRTAQAEFFRQVGAPLLQRKALSRRAVTIEWIERKGAGPVDWRYRQDRDALFYFERGIAACRGSLDGAKFDRRLNGASKLAFIEAGSTVEGEVNVPGRCMYWVAFIDRAHLLGPQQSIEWRIESRIGLDNSVMISVLNGLRPELLRDDELSTLYLESWAMQAMVLLHRSSDSCRMSANRRIGRSELSKVIEYMEANVGSDLTLDSIAKLVDLSPRHLRRVLLAATGLGPSEMFTNIRLDRVARQLRHSRKSVTEIALECGFSQPQHLATAFRRKFGSSPTEFRRGATS
jgi:AraC-like DNA-binding protein